MILEKARRQAINLLCLLIRKYSCFWNRTVNCLQNITFIWNTIAAIPKASKLIQPQIKYFLLLVIAAIAERIKTYCVLIIPYYWKRNLYLSKSKEMIKDTAATFTEWIYKGLRRASLYIWTLHCATHFIRHYHKLQKPNTTFCKADNHKLQKHIETRWKRVYNID